MYQQQLLEKSAFSAWPSLEQSQDQGIVYRFAKGYTKRANSANVLALENWQLPALVTQIEGYFHERAQPSIVRIPSFVKADALDQYLAQAGYSYASKSLVMKKTIAADIAQTELKILNAGDWLKCFVQLSDSALEQHGAHLEILERIDDQKLFAVLEKAGKAVACGLGVIGRGQLGIFDLVCAKSCRRQGYGAELVSGIHSWALNKGVQTSYLQVLATNTAAVALYQKLGFREDYYYWYRIK